VLKQIRKFSTYRVTIKPPLSQLGALQEVRLITVQTSYYFGPIHTTVISTYKAKSRCI